MSHNTSNTSNTTHTKANRVGYHAAGVAVGFVRGNSILLKIAAYATEVAENAVILGVKYTYKKVTQNSKTEQFEITKGFSEGWNEMEAWSQALETTVNNNIKNMSINDITL
jgi:hypothetical protein